MTAVLINEPDIDSPPVTRHRRDAHRRLQATGMHRMRDGGVYVTAMTCGCTSNASSLGVHCGAAGSRMLHGRGSYERAAFDVIATSAFSSGPACSLTEVRGDGEHQEDRQKRDSRHYEVARVGSLSCSWPTPL